VPIDIAAAQLPRGATFEIRDAQDYFGRPVVTGTYDGRPVNLVMSGLRAVAPVGNVPVVPPHTAPTFAAFVVVPSAAVPTGPATPDPAVTLSLSSPSVQPGQSATLSWSASNASTVTIDQGVGTVALNGSRTIAPQTTTTYTAVAVNTAGVRKTSAVTLSVAGTPPAPPVPPTNPGTVTVKMTLPVNNSWAIHQGTVTVAADLNDPAGIVTRIEFYRGPTNIGTAFKKPYSLQWTYVQVGTYSITARVYSRMGVIATSAPTVLNVSR
jgi:hypothetical protein